MDNLLDLKLAGIVDTDVNNPVLLLEYLINNGRVKVHELIATPVSLEYAIPVPSKNVGVTASRNSIGTEYNYSAFITGELELYKTSEMDITKKHTFLGKSIHHQDVLDSLTPILVLGRDAKNRVFITSIYVRRLTYTEVIALYDYHNMTLYVRGIRGPLVYRGDVDSMKMIRDVVYEKPQLKYAIIPPTIQYYINPHYNYSSFDGMVWDNIASAGVTTVQDYNKYVKSGLRGLNDFLPYEKLKIGVKVFRFKDSVFTNYSELLLHYKTIIELRIPNQDCGFYRSSKHKNSAIIPQSALGNVNSALWCNYNFYNILDSLEGV